MLHTEPASSTGLLERLEAKLEAKTGLSFVGIRRRDLQQAVRRMAGSAGIESDVECAEWLLSGRWDKEKSDLCADHLTVPETYFFREPAAFGLVCDHAQEKIRRYGAASAQLRIWSAGCCTGEEAYSIAMALRQAVPRLEPEQISILGTDINAHSLEIARAGRYRQWSFRNKEAALYESYFLKADDGRMQLKSQIRDLVKFAELNLASPVYPSAETDSHGMDIIFCRNVLMYFSRAQARKVIARFRECLVDGGLLIVSPSEASAAMFPGFSGMYFTDAIYFKKNAALDSLPAGRPAVSEAAPAERPPECRPAAPQRTRAFQGAPGGSAPSQSPLAVSADTYRIRALLAIEASDPAQAIYNLKKLLYLQPDLILGRYLMGLMCSQQGQHGRAIRQFEITRQLLEPLGDDELVPETEGWSAAYLRESVQGFLKKSER